MKIKELIEISHRQACEKGFWNNEDWNISEKLMLIVSELAEANEALRKNDRQLSEEDYRISITTGPDEKLKLHFFDRWKKDTFEDELADTVIRIADLCGKMGIDLEWQIEKKLAFNKTRGYKHGKSF
jgi:NTP pyrophosphatase (non-canonical NTP hydrolase)